MFWSIAASVASSRRICCFEVQKIIVRQFIPCFTSAEHKDDIEHWTAGDAQLFFPNQMSQLLLLMLHEKWKKCSCCALKCWMRYLKTNPQYKFLTCTFSLPRNNNEGNSYLISLFSLLCPLLHFILKHKRKQTTSKSAWSVPCVQFEEEPLKIRYHI